MGQRAEMFLGSRVLAHALHEPRFAIHADGYEVIVSIVLGRYRVRDARRLTPSGNRRVPVQPNPDPVTLLENNREADRNRSLDPIHCDVHDRVGSHPSCVPGRYHVPGNPLEPRTLRLRKVARELTANLRPSNPALIGTGTDQEHVRIVSEQLRNAVDVLRSVPLGVTVECPANSLLCSAIQSHRASRSRSKIDRTLPPERRANGRGTTRGETRAGCASLRQYTPRDCSRSRQGAGRQLALNRARRRCSWGRRSVTVSA